MSTPHNPSDQKASSNSAVGADLHLSPDFGARLYDQTVEQLGRSIVMGTLQAGESISPEALATSLGLSRSVLREAFRALEAKGLVQARPRVGTRVAPPSQWNYLDAQLISWRLQSRGRIEQVEELYATRLAIEPIAARLIADHADPETISHLRELIASMRQAMDARDLHAFTEADSNFHTALLDHAGNKMFSCFNTLISAAIRTRETLIFPMVEETQHGLEMHELLVQQIEAGAFALEETARRLIDHAHIEARAALTYSESDERVS